MIEDHRIKIYRKLLKKVAGKVGGSLVAEIHRALQLRKPTGRPNHVTIKREFNLLKVNSVKDNPFYVVNKDAERGFLTHVKITRGNLSDLAFKETDSYGDVLAEYEDTLEDIFEDSEDDASP